VLIYKKYLSIDNLEQFPQNSFWNKLRQPRNLLTKAKPKVTGYSSKSNLWIDGNELLKSSRLSLVRQFSHKYIGIVAWSPQNSRQLTMTCSRSVRHTGAHHARQREPVILGLEGAKARLWPLKWCVWKPAQNTPRCTSLFVAVIRIIRIKAFTSVQVSVNAIE